MRSTWAALSEAQRRFLVRDQLIGPAIINAVLNGVIAAVVFRGQARIPFDGPQGVAADLGITMLLMSSLVSGVGGFLVARSVQRGDVEPLPGRESLPWALQILPTFSHARSACFAVLSLGLFAVLPAWALRSAGVESVSMVLFVIAKALYCGGIAAAVSALTALHVLAVTPRELAIPARPRH